MNYVEIKIDDEICRVSWDGNEYDQYCGRGVDIEKVQINYVGDIIKQTLLGIGYLPQTVNEYFQPDEDKETVNEYLQPDENEEKEIIK